MQRQRPFPPLDPLLPARLFLGERVLRLGAVGRCGRRRLARVRQPRLGRLPLLLELGLGRQTRLEPIHLVSQRVATLADALLRDRELLVPQHARQKRGALGPRGIGEHRQLFLTGEVGVEEFVVRHAEDALQAGGDFLERIRDDDAVLIQLGVVETAFDAKRVAPQGEFQLHAHRGARLGAQVSD